ncbi:hypothetical protein J4442_02115 [Candidatus Woesearchaeota archaeon]|nr:hypothetical protein [Candidatus Woesearchaeota archaeon]
MDDIKIVMWYILVRLKNMRKWGGAHSELKRVLKSLPSHISNRKSVDKAVKELNNLSLIGVYKKTGEEHVSLNSRKVSEINNFIDEVQEKINGNDFVE